MDVAQHWIAAAMAYVASLQRDLTRGLSLYLRQADSPESAIISAMVLAFALGMLHAVTPGHGKIVVFSYFFGRTARPWTGIGISLRIAATHIATAIVLFALADVTETMFFGRTAGAARIIQAVSYFMIILIGGALLYQSLRRHQVEPGASTLQGGAFPIAVGLLPCPLTLLILSYAMANASMVAGLLLVLVMGIGIAVTISTVALLGMLARRTTLVALNPARLANSFKAVEVLGSSAIIIVGAVMFLATVKYPR